MIAGRYDVVVAGGGLAGIAAARSAAAGGAETLLVEREPNLGGNVTQAWVHTICGLHHADRPTPEYLNEGFPRQFAERLLASGGARPVERVGRVFVLPIYPEAVADYCAALCAEGHAVLVRTGTAIVSAQLDRAPRAAARLVLDSGEGPVEVEAKAIIDATGDGAVAALLGADLLPNGPDPLQSCSLIFRLSGVADGAVRGFESLRVSAAVAGAVLSGGLPPGCDSVLVRPGRAKGTAYVTLNLAPLGGREHRPLDAEYMSELMEVGRERARLVLAYLRCRRAEFAEAVLEGWPERVGVRETRRIAGDYVVSEEDVLTGARRDDDVALSSWPIEFWSDYRRARFVYPSGACGIPLGALRSRSHAELGMAGRCVSGSRPALGSLRVLGAALAMGEAIGNAAAFAVANSMSLRDVTGQIVREIGRRDGRHE